MEDTTRRGIRVGIEGIRSVVEEVGRVMSTDACREEVLIGVVPRQNVRRCC